MSTSKTTSDLVFHYKCKNCRVVVARDGDRWVDQDLRVLCHRAHLPNGQFTNGSRNSTCRYCGVPLDWADMAWRGSLEPKRYACNLEHAV